MMIDYLICSFSNKTFLRSSQINKKIKRLIPSHFNKETLTISDGGEDLKEILFNKKYMKFYKIRVTSANNKKINVNIPFCKKKKFALIEFSKIIGGFNKKFKDGMYRTSIGVGESIDKISKRGIKKIIISTGGSTVSDFGIGMLNYLGASFFNKHNNIIKFKKRVNCSELKNIKKIDFKKIKINLKKIKLIILSDSSVKIIGKFGQVQTFAQQKGIYGNEKKILEKGFINFFKVLSSKSKKKLNINYLGAGGGICASLYSNFNASLVPATKYLFAKINLIKKIKLSNTIISGEGILDKSSFMGKGVGEIIKLVKHHKKNLILIVGINKYKKLPKSCKIIEINNKNFNLNKNRYFKLLEKKIKNELNEKD